MGQELFALDAGTALRIGSIAFAVAGGALSLGTKRVARMLGSDPRAAEGMCTVAAYALTSISMLLFAAMAWI